MPAEVKEITDLPVRLFNTHTDPDHIGSNSEFDEVMMNLSELVNYKLPHPSQRIIPVYDGDTIDIGGRELLAIALPGHTPGSTGLLDKSSDILKKNLRMRCLGFSASCWCRNT